MLCTVLVAVTLTDLELRLIPNAIVLAGALAAVAIVAVSDPSSLGERASPPRLPAVPCCWSRSRIRGEWGWVT